MIIELIGFNFVFDSLIDWFGVLNIVIIELIGLNFVVAAMAS